jgi:ABC-type Mn2+/Zn2+ transport system ATPase subunit
MPVLNIKLDNILAFNDFEINLSYPKKLQNTLIQDENLFLHPSFRYKKLNIFVGSNASGKTSLIKCIWTILLFLKNKEKNIIDSIINDNGKEATIVMDYVFEYQESSKLQRIIISSFNKELKMAFNELNIKNGDSYEGRIKDLDRLEYKFKNYIEVLNCFDFVDGWNVVLPATEEGFDNIKILELKDDEEKDYFEILNNVLKTLDPAIMNVRKSNDAPNAIVVEHENTGIVIIQDGMKLSSINFLSSGTKYGINLANIIFAIKHHINGIYLIDEQFSYVNSDIESSILSTMVSLLGPNEQIFFTTHNANILDLGFPFHSFNFMKKIKEEGKQRIVVSCATEVENRNNVPVRSILDNDMLGTAPNVNKIYEIAEK